jgi:hypothetical protein
MSARLPVLLLCVALVGCSGPMVRTAVPEPTISPAPKGSGDAETVVREYVPSYGAVDHDELFPIADLVALVRVTSQTDKTIGRDYIWRESQVEVLVAFKGQPFERIQQAGGELAGRKDVFQGMRYLDVAHTYLVFLEAGDIAGVPSVQFFGDPGQLAFAEPTPGVFVSLDGTYQFTLSEIQALAGVDL